MLTEVDIRFVFSSLGISCYSDYVEFVKSGKHNKYKDSFYFSPENADQRDFWKVIDSIGLFDAVSNCEGKTEYNTLEVSSDRNKQIFNNMCRIDSFLPVDSDYSLLDIGAGYAWLQNYVPCYTGVDTVVRDVSIVQTDEFGLIHEIDDRYDFTVSSNVFQHLTYKQMLYYFDFAKRYTNEKFIFNYFAFPGEICHYLQTTVVYKITDIADLAKFAGWNYEIYRFNSLFYTVCLTHK